MPDSPDTFDASAGVLAGIPKDVIDAIYTKQYYLLLGAGASAGVVNRANEPIPTGNKLLEGINDYFELGDNVLSLQQTTDLIRDLGIENKSSVEDYLTNKFSHCIPTWQGILYKFNWNYIFTLNIDDVLENAFQPNETIVYREQKSYTWNDDFNNDRSGTATVVHLHGYVHHKPKKDYVFSLAQYADALSSKRAWHNIFWDTLPQRPYIIVGASLTNEFDLQTAINKLQKRVDDNFPTIFVSPDVNPIIERALKRKGIIICKAKGEEFFQALLYFYSQKYGTKKSTHAHDFAFGQQFEQLPLHKRAPKTHDFFQGHEPIMQDIIESKDAILEHTNEIKNRIQQDINGDLATDESVLRVYIVAGLPGNGKSTAALRIGYELSQLGHSVFRYLEPEEADIYSIIGFAEDKSMVMIFDNAGSYRSSLQVIHTRLRSSKGKHYLIIVDRTRSLKDFRDYLKANEIDEDYAISYGSLSKSDSERIVSKLGQFGRLDSLLDVNEQDRSRVFLKRSPLINAMYSLSYAQPYKDRMLTELTNMNDPIAKITYFLAAALYAQSIRLSLSWLSSFTNRPQEELLNTLANEEATMLRIELGNDASLTMQSRVFAEDFMSSLNTQGQKYDEYRELKYRTVLVFLRWLSRFIDSKHPNLDSRYYRAASRLLDHEVLSKWFDQEIAKNLYDELKDWWGDNARFWEQYALLSAKMADYEPAISYARTAIRIHRDTFTLNTLGTILLKASYNHVTIGSRRSLEILMEGVSALEEAREARRSNEYPFKTFFSHIIAYMSRLEDKSGEIPEYLDTKFEEWFRSAKHNPLFSGPIEQRWVQAQQFSWLRATRKI